MNYRGPFDIKATYQVGDVVLFNGSLYAASREAFAIFPDNKRYFKVVVQTPQKGDKGDKGDSVIGPKGDKGDKGDTVIGPPGPAGKDGLTIKGPKGDKGDKGDDGLSAYQIAVKEGFKGTEKEWLASLRGRDSRGSRTVVNNQVAKWGEVSGTITDQHDLIDYIASHGGASNWGNITGTLSAQTDLQAALDAKVTANGAITGATKTKITYDANGLVTSGADAAIADITGLQAALDLKAPLSSPTFTGTVSGITKAMVGLGNVDNTSDLNKPISTATQTALDAKIDDSQVSAFGLTLIDDADAATARTTLGLGTLATQSGTFSGTSSGTNTGDQNLFRAIAVSGQSDVVADSTTDTLTLVAGTNITITTDAGTDTITINASGGGGGGLTYPQVLSAVMLG